ncbi:MAG: DUF2189 domain-containing protein [Candidatus Thiodiazotropha sp. DIVDIV]
MESTDLKAEKITPADLYTVIKTGWTVFRASPLPSVAYASIAGLIGLILLYAIGNLGISPMSLPFAGGFMLIAPAMLGGFFQVAQNVRASKKVEVSTPFKAFFKTPLQTWMVAIFCAFMFLIWITDAGVLYSFIVSGTDLHYKLPWIIQVNESIGRFWFWGMVMGAALAFIIFCVSAFSVPLLFEGRGSIVEAVHASVRAVFSNFLTTMMWAMILSLFVFISIILLPLILLILPTMSYASFALYRIVFPQVK